MTGLNLFLTWVLDEVYLLLRTGKSIPFCPNPRIDLGRRSNQEFGTDERK
jgi:hypothetical protein